VDPGSLPRGCRSHERKDTCLSPARTRSHPCSWRGVEYTREETQGDREERERHIETETERERKERHNRGRHPQGERGRRQIITSHVPDVHLRSGIRLAEDHLGRNVCLCAAECVAELAFPTYNTLNNTHTHIYTTHIHTG